MTCNDSNLFDPCYPHCSQCCQKLASLSRGSGCTLSLSTHFSHVRRRMQRLHTAWHWHRTEMNRDEPRWTQDKGMLLFDVYIYNYIYICVVCKRMQLCLTCVLQDLHYSTRLRQDEVAICSQFALWLSEVRPWPTVAKHGIGTAYFLVHFSARLKEKEITDKWKTYERMHNFRCAWQRSPWLFAQLFTHLGPSKASERHCIGAARVESLSSAAWPGWPGWPGWQPVFSYFPTPPTSCFGLFGPLAFWFWLPVLRHSFYLSPLAVPILRLTSDESLKSGADASNNSWVKQWISSSNRIYRCKVSSLRRYHFVGHKLSTVKSSAAARQALPLDLLVTFFTWKTKMPPLLKNCRLYGEGKNVARLPLEIKIHQVG